MELKYPEEIQQIQIIFFPLAIGPLIHNMLGS